MRALLTWCEAQWRANERLWTYAALAGLAFGTLALHDRDVRALAAKEAVAQQQLHAATQSLVLWQARYDSAKRAVAHDTVTLTRLLTRLAVDTAWRHDTVRIAGDTTARLAVPVTTVQRTDSVIRSCRQIVASIVPLTTGCDSVRAALTRERDSYQSLYEATRPRIWDRLGVSVGYGLTLTGGAVRAGPQAALSVRVWP